MDITHDTTKKKFIAQNLHCIALPISLEIILNKRHLKQTTYIQLIKMNFVFKLIFSVKAIDGARNN